MKEVATRVVSIAGNTVIDIPLRDVNISDSVGLEFVGNVDIMKDPVIPLLGGCGASAAFVLGAHGQPVTLNTNIGNDSWGRLATGWLESVGVKICDRVCHTTAAHMIKLDREGRRQSYYYLGEKVKWELSLNLGSPYVFYSSGYGAVNTDDIEQMCNVFSDFRASGTRVVFDISPWFEGIVPKSLMLEAFKHVDYLIGTEDEFREWEEGESIPKLARNLLKNGVEYVVIKKGRLGAYAISQFGEEVNAKVAISSKKYTVGAGDCFNGRLLYGICHEEPFVESVKYAANFATRIVDLERGALGAIDISCKETEL